MGIVVKIAYRIEEVERALRYRGWVRIAGVRVDVGLQAAFPIHDTRGRTAAKTTDELRKQMRITVTKGGNNIELTDDQYHFFYEVAATVAVDMHMRVHIVDETLKRDMGGRDPISTGEMKQVALFSQNLDGRIELGPRMVESLQDPKFGWKIKSSLH